MERKNEGKTIRPLLAYRDKYSQENKRDFPLIPKSIF